MNKDLDRIKVLLPDTFLHRVLADRIILKDKMSIDKIIASDYDYCSKNDKNFKLNKLKLFKILQEEGFIPAMEMHSGGFKNKLNRDLLKEGIFGFMKYYIKKVCK